MAKYTPQTWTDGVSSASAARMLNLENGIREASMGRSTTFPSSPIDGDIHIYPADTTNGIMWHFMYNSGSASAHKWEFIGGSALSAEVETSEGTTSTTFVDLTTAGPSITVPKAGDYYVVMQARMSNGTAGGFCVSAVKIGAAATADADGAILSSGTAGETATLEAHRVKTCAASDILKVQYRVSAGTGTFLNRRLFIIPRRVTP